MNDISLKNIRQSNFELLRIISMIMVVMFHCNYFSLGDLKTFNPQTGIGVMRVIWEQSCCVCVNIFVLISGWFGINPKIKSLASLLFQVLFFSGLIILICRIVGIPTPLLECLKSLYFGSSYWFVPAYIILYSLTPILNKFINNSTNQELLITIVVFFVVEFLFGFIWDVGSFQKGYTPWSFIGLYLLARYCKLYPSHMTTMSWKKNLLYYVVLTMIPSLIIICIGKGNRMIYYNSPFVILASLYLLLTFAKLRFQNVIVNWIACSAFSVYLIHQHVLIIPIFRNYMMTLWKTTIGSKYVLYCVLIAFSLLFIGTMLDKVRIFLWLKFTDFIQKYIGRSFTRIRPFIYDD